MSRLLNYILDSLREPHDKLRGNQHYVRRAWELTALCWRQLQVHRAEGMAAELTYRTIFSLIPVVVLGLVTFRIVGGLEDVQSSVENELYSFFGVPEFPDGYLQDEESSDPAIDEEAVNTDGGSTPLIATTPLSGDDTIPGDSITADSNEQNENATAIVDLNEALENTKQDAEAAQQQAQQEEAEAAEETRREARASIRRTLRQVTAKVASVDFKSIGAFGLILFIYAAVALADSTEHLFNRIYDAPSQRPIHIRVAIHWSIITLGSGLLAMSLYMSSQVVDWFGEQGAGATTRLLLSHLLSIGASWVLLFLLYALMPNTNVSVRAAAIGSLVGSLLWEAAKFGFQIYVAKAVPYSAIYGSIGLIPLFLFWIYLTWLIILFGLILTYTLQTLRGRSPDRVRWNDEPLPPGDPDWMLPIMCEVALAFRQGTRVDNQELADKIGLSSRISTEMTGKLVEAGLLQRVTSGAAESEGLTLARPAESISITEILSLAHQTRPTSDHPAWKSLAGLKRAEREAAGNKTLAELIAEQIPDANAQNGDH